MSKGQTKAEIAAEKLKKERATQKPLQYSAAPTTGLATQGPKREYMSASNSMMSTSKANKPAAVKPSRPTVKSVEVNKKPLAGVGSRQISSPTTFRTDQQSNLSSMASNFSKPSAKETKKSNRKLARKVNKSIRQQNKIDRISNRQQRRADRIIKRESQGLDASVSRSKLKTGAKRLNRLRNK